MVRAVDDVSLAVEEKELLVLVGPSGCGKTTLLRLVAGLEEPTSGTIRIDGQVANARPPKEREIAMVFQSAALYPHLTVGENLALGMKLRGIGKRERQARMAETAELLGITECLGRRPMELSGGEKQRAALGRALVRRPKMILLDEPLSNLDAPLRGRMRVELARLQQQLGMTMVYVTHDQAEALALGHRLAVMNAGAIQQSGQSQDVYERPANVFVASFLGTPPMNFFPGRLARRGKEYEFEPDSAAEASLALGSEQIEKVRGHRDGRLVLGLRPKDVEAIEPGGKGMSGAVELVEGYGTERYARVRVGQEYLTAWMKPGREVRVGERVGLRLDVEKAHWFEEQTGNRVEIENRK